MFHKTILNGQKLEVDVLGHVSTLALRVSQTAETKTEALEHLKRIKISAKIISTTSRDNITLFTDMPLFVVMALVNHGTSFIQQVTDDSVPAKDFLYCNVPVCMDGALQMDKTRYIRLTVDMTAENLSAGSAVDVYSLGSTGVGTEPIRIVENRFRPKEATHIGLAGVRTLMYQKGVIDTASYVGVTGTRIELTDEEYPFYGNVFADLAVATQDENGTTKGIKDQNIMPCATFVKVEIEAGEVDNFPVYLFYGRYADSQIGCEC